MLRKSETTIKGFLLYIKLKGHKIEQQVIVT